MKKCIKCGEEKNNDSFYKWYKKTGTTGHRNDCIKCVLLVNNRYRKEKKDLLKSKRRIRTGAKPKKYCTDPIQKKRNEDMYRSARKYPEKTLARSFLSYYVKKGKIVKPDSCEICFEKTKVEGHHQDYSKPLEVKWLCKRCHTDIHWKSEKR
jgi:hypothetical protein